MPPRTHGIADGLAHLAVPIASLSPDPSSARRHPARNIKAVVDSLRLYGQQKPIVVSSDGVILAGNAVYDAAMTLGWTHVAAVTSGLAGHDRRGYAIADNQSGDLSRWDEAMLAEQLRELDAHCESLDLEELGFTEVELVRLLQPEISVDEIPEPGDEHCSENGAVYRLGEHRLLVGDATDPAALARLTDEGPADLLLTDPPYNVAYEGKTAEALTIANDSMDDAAFRAFLTDAFRAADSVMRPGAAYYVWHADSEGLNFRMACRSAGWTVRQNLVWVKNSMVLGRQDYQWQHEPCLYGWKDGAAHTWLGGRRHTTVIDQADPLTTVLRFDRPGRNAEHPTMKPVDLFEFQVRNSARRGEVVLDPFGGSGTTVIACERTGRRARTMELDPRYADVIRKRWAEHVHGSGCDWRRLTPAV